MTIDFNNIGVVKIFDQSQLVDINEVVLNNQVLWKKNDSEIAMCKFTALEDNTIIRLKASKQTILSDEYPLNLTYYKNDSEPIDFVQHYNEEWNDNNTIRLNKDDTVLIKTTQQNEYFSKSNAEYFTFKISGCVSCDGVNSLINQDGKLNKVPEYAFYNLFDNCTSLIYPPRLPSETVLAHGYDRMFHGCGSLREFPELPAMTLGENCYDHMFEDCKSVVSTNMQLRAEFVPISGYYNMFNGCVQLSNAPSIYASYISKSGCEQMFAYCYELVKPMDEISAKFENAAFRNMFLNCHELTATPDFSKTYKYPLCASTFAATFSHCYKLSTAFELPWTELKSYCYNGMYASCTSLTAVPELPATTLAEGCYRGMFDMESTGNDLITEAAISAKNLNGNFTCYRMFRGCHALSTVNTSLTSSISSSQDSKNIEYMLHDTYTNPVSGISAKFYSYHEYSLDEIGRIAKDDIPTSRWEFVIKQ